LLLLHSPSSSCDITLSPWCSSSFTSVSCTPEFGVASPPEFLPAGGRAESLGFTGRRLLHSPSDLGGTLAHGPSQYTSLGFPYRGCSGQRAPLGFARAQHSRVERCHQLPHDSSAPSRRRIGEGCDAPKLPCPFITPCTTLSRMKSAASRPCASASAASAPASWRPLCAPHRRLGRQRSSLSLRASRRRAPRNPNPGFVEQELCWWWKVCIDRAEGRLRTW
jgi:hypothetical protein